MGIPGDFMNEKVIEAYKTMIAACKAHGKIPGMGGIYAPDQMKKIIDLGALMILSGSDFAFMMKGAREQAAAVRALK